MRKLFETNLLNGWAYTLWVAVWNKDANDKAPSVTVPLECESFTSIWLLVAPFKLYNGFGVTSFPSSSRIYQVKSNK